MRYELNKDKRKLLKDKLKDFQEKVEMYEKELTRLRTEREKHKVKYYSTYTKSIKDCESMIQLYKNGIEKMQTIINNKYIVEVTV